jgi:hypothetical protein
MSISVSRRWALLGALAGVLALTVATALGGELKQKSKTEALPDDNDVHFATAKCPKGHKLTGGGGQLAAADTPQFSDSTYPVNKRKWTASGLNFIVMGFSEDSELTAHAVCLEDATVKLKEKSGSPSPTDPFLRVTAKCPKGTKVSGGGIEVDSENTPGAGSYPSGKRKWTAVGLPSVGEEVTAHAACLEGRKLRRKQKTQDVEGSFDTQTITVKCGKGTKPTGGGPEFDPTEVAYEGSYPTRRGWKVEVHSETGTPGEATAHVVCLEKQ